MTPDPMQVAIASINTTNEQLMIAIHQATTALEQHPEFPAMRARLRMAGALVRDVGNHALRIKSRRDAAIAGARAERIEIKRFEVHVTVDGLGSKRLYRVCDKPGQFANDDELYMTPAEFGAMVGRLASLGHLDTVTQFASCYVIV